MGYDVFISFKRGALDGSGLTRDYELAADLHKTLRENGISAFFSVKDLSTSAFRDEIDNALDDAKVLIAVGTKRENLEAQNVKYEWRSFYDDLLQGFKPEGEIYTYLEGMDQMQLPRALRQRQSFQSNQKEELVRWIKGNLGMAENQPMPKIVLNPQPEPRVIPRTIDTASVRSDPILVHRAGVRLGKIIKFGQYPQGSKGEIMPIEWRVLDVQDGKALLLTDKLLDYAEYNEKYENVTWENCSLRQWMNGEFIQKAFSAEEQNKIALTINTNSSNPQYSTKGGNETEDMVFALSIEEAKKYFDLDRSRKAFTTSYARKLGRVYDDGSDYWWLRSPGCNSVSAADVNYDGGINSYGNFVNRGLVAVRFALWMNL
ncbi:MAG: DUF6273 domain-containing protein [Acutalibacteraceae bacterium]